MSVETKVFELVSEDPLRGERRTVNFGPQHPATHGVLRIVLTLDGETVVAADPVVGYLHRGKEKTAESLGWHRFFPHTDRLDYTQSIGNNVAYALAVEALMGLEVPPRGQAIRVILAELSRIGAHLIFVGTTAIDLGAVSVFFLSFRERERIYDVFDRMVGHRMNPEAIRFGGVIADLDEEAVAGIRELVRDFPARFDELESLLTRNPIWISRTRDVGTISAERAVALSLTGPNLRGSGVRFDLRKSLPYLGYERYDFEVPVGARGDAYDRYLVRVEEMRQSLRIVEQALEGLPEGEVFAEDRRYVLPPKVRALTSMEELIHQFKVVTDLRVPRGEVYRAVEAPKGELGFYLVSKGEIAPHRCHIRSPSFINLQALAPMAVGRRLSDLVAITSSLDFVMGEVDR
ncbi:MAG TPA: NADH dehydrogenase (quinone) subunit D [Planctomycetota bacterium]|jgi:NADH-quinone oxidoreductase subunit D|nr:NADH dehydrogenase (quinone) subunit D [Planctomycetota bacterium]